MNEQQTSKSIGAFWIKEGQSGKFWSGILELEPGKKIQVVAFKNDRKEPGSNQPDIRLLLAKPREDQPAPKDDVPTIDSNRDIPF